MDSWPVLGHVFLPKNHMCEFPIKKHNKWEFPIWYTKFTFFKWETCQHPKAFATRTTLCSRPLQALKSLPWKRTHFVRWFTYFHSYDDDVSIKYCDFPIKNCDVPFKNGDFPIKHDGFPIKNDDCPIKHDDYPIKIVMFLLKMVIFHSSVSVPEANPGWNSCHQPVSLYLVDKPFCHKPVSTHHFII